MFGEQFSQDLIRKFVIMFGTLFNNVVIARFDNNGDRQQNFKVPISYGPREKYLGMTKQKPDGKVQAVVLPRMAFEITGYEYISDRQLFPGNRIFRNSSGISYEYAPWDISFELNIIAKNAIDATRIVEQILPYFTPHLSVSAELVQNLPPVDINIDLTSVSNEDIYEGSFEERRVLTWTLTFTLHGFLAKPKTPAKVIKMVDVNIQPNTSTTMLGGERIRTQPGLTANGDPTTSLNDTIPYQDIEFDDPYGIIVTVTDIINND